MTACCPTPGQWCAWPIHKFDEATRVGRAHLQPLAAHQRNARMRSHGPLHTLWTLDPTYNCLQGCVPTTRMATRNGLDVQASPLCTHASPTMTGHPQQAHWRIVLLSCATARWPQRCKSRCAHTRSNSGRQLSDSSVLPHTRPTV